MTGRRAKKFSRLRLSGKPGHCVNEPGILRNKELATAHQRSNLKHTLSNRQQHSKSSIP
jgi:hypothetical protein